jgi:hypothetical protein
MAKQGKSGGTITNGRPSNFGTGDGTQGAAGTVRKGVVRKGGK